MGYNSRESSSKYGKKNSRESSSKYDKKNRYQNRLFWSLCLILVVLFVLNGRQEVLSHHIDETAEWNLIVVNRWNPIPEQYEVTLRELSNGQKVDARIYPYLQDMFDAARENGIYPIVREGYRTQEEQTELLEEKILAFEQEGHSEKRARKLAAQWVALPGTSEHQLGIAVDINADQKHAQNDKVYTWLADHAHEYGFILRYPPGKEKLTGTGYEPWHYRYVGKEAAQEIHERGICLEEYRREESLFQ